MLVDRRGSVSRWNTSVALSTIIGGAIGNVVGHNKSKQRVGAVLGALLEYYMRRNIMRSEKNF